MIASFVVILRVLITFLLIALIKLIWDWKTAYNGFTFTCSTISDLWLLDSAIPLKDRLLVEMIRGAVIWTVWLERNKVCLKGSNFCIS